MEQSALTPEEVRKDILLSLFSLHWLAQGAARLPGRWARLWFYFAGCRFSRKAVGIRKCLLKKKKVKMLPVVLPTVLPSVWSSNFQVLLPSEWGRREVLRAASPSPALGATLLFRAWGKTCKFLTPSTIYTMRGWYLCTNSICRLRACNVTNFWGTTLSRPSPHLSCAVVLGVSPRQQQGRQWAPVPLTCFHLERKL